MSFFHDLLRMNQHLHQRALGETQVIMVVSTFLFSILLTKVFSSDFITTHLFAKIGLLIIVLTSLFSMLLSILILRPQYIKKRKREDFNPFYFKTYPKTEEEFLSLVKNIEDDDEKLKRVYFQEMYNFSQIIAQHYNIINRSADFLIFGLIGGLIFFIMSFIL